MPSGFLTGRFIELERVLNAQDAVFLTVITQAGLSVDKSNTSRVSTDCAGTFAILSYQEALPVTHEGRANFANVQSVITNVRAKSVHGSPIRLGRLALLLSDDFVGEFKEIQLKSFVVFHDKLHHLIYRHALQCKAIQV